MISQEFWELGRIVIDFPLSYQYIKQLSVKEEANEHGTLSLLLVSDKTLTQEEILRLEDVPIQVYTMDGAVVFAGVCTSAGINNLSGYSEIAVEAKSWSFKADIKLNSRTFQSPTKQLSEVVDTVIGTYGFAISLEKDMPITIMLSQQNETDWHFIRRIANQFGLMMFADSKSPGKRISIGVVPFTEQPLPKESNSTLMGKDIAAYWQVKNEYTAEASAYEFLKHGYQLADLALGVGHAVSGGACRQIITGSEISAIQGLLTNSVMLTYQDGAYPPASTDLRGSTGGTQGAASGTSEAPIQASNAAIGSSVVSGVVLAVAGNDIQVQFSVDGPGGGVRWVPYGSFFSNDFYCMPDIGDTVFCYYENNGTVVCLGSKHVNTGAPDFSKPEDKVLTANNRMIKQKSDGIDITGNRPELDGLGGDRIKIIISDTDGIEISASKEVNITAERTLLIQSNDLEEVRDNPTEWIDSQRKEKMAQFDADQKVGSDKYIADGGNNSYNAGWDLAKTLGGNLLTGFINDITSPFQIVTTIGSMISPDAPPEEKPLIQFDKVYEYQILILGLESCTLQVPNASIRFSNDTIVIAGPKFWWLGFNRSSDYPQQSESQRTFMDSIMDAVQLAIDVVGCIPGCNVICGALNAGISLLRGDYYGALSGVMGMVAPGAGLATRALGMMGKAAKTVQKVLKALKVLKAGAVGLNALLTGGQSVAELIDKISKGKFDITNPEDFDLLVSIGRSALTSYQSGKTIHDTLHPKKPEGNAKKDDEDPKKKEDGKETDSDNQKKENEVTCNDPINVITGSQKIAQTEFVIKDVTESFRLVRTYESLHTNGGGLLGNKWYLNVGSWISVKENAAVIIMPDMHLENFTKVEDEWVNDRGGDRSVQLAEVKNGYALMVLAEKKLYHYDSTGKLISITDRNKNSTWLQYVNNTLTEITFAGGQILKFNYESGKVSSITDKIGRTVRYGYEGEFLTKVEYPNHGVIHYSYTPEGYLQQVIDQNGNAYVHNDYDMQGRVTRQVLSTGQEYFVLYDDSRRVNTFLTEANGRRFEYHYNKDKLLTKKVYMDGTFEETEYDQYQNKVMIKDRMGGELRRRFDENGKLLEEQLPNGLVTSFTYDGDGNLIRQWDNAGREQESSYDDKGNCILMRIAIDRGHWQETAFEYDAHGRVLTITDPRGNRADAKYGETGSGMISFTTAEGTVIHYTYDEVGRCMSISNESGRTEYAYNPLDYVTMVTDPLGNTKKYFFDMLCNLTKVVQPNQYDRKIGDGSGMRFLYDAFDEQIQRIDPLGNVFATLRDLEENIVKEINPNSYDPETRDGAGICHEYDQDDRRIKTIYPDGGMERIKYDANGNIIKRIRPEQYDRQTDDGPGYCYEYDCVNRLVQITDPEGNVVRRYVYDLRGFIMKEIDAQGYLFADQDEKRIGILYRRNAIGWMTQKREPVKVDAKEAVKEPIKEPDRAEVDRVLYRLTEYSYDDAGNMIRERRFLDFQDETSTRGPVHTISFDYDKDNRRIRVSDSTGAVVEYKYNSQNQRIYEKRKLGDELSQTFRYEYDAAGRMVCVSSSMGKSDSRQSYAKTQYTYDKTGNMTRITMPEGGEIYREYDTADRLVTEIHHDKKSGIVNRTKFGFDKAGNLVRIIDSLGRKTTIEYDLLNRELRRIEKDGSVTRRFYDGNGWLAREIRPNQYEKHGDEGAGYQYTYNQQGQVVTVISPDGHVMQSNTYDGNGRLLQQLDDQQSGAEFTYDLAGNRTKIRTSGNASQELEYDAWGNIIGVVDGNHNHTHYELDTWGRVTEIVKPDGASEYYTYDNAGNMTSSTDGEGHTTWYQYDRAGKITAIIDPTGETEQYSYNKEGRLVWRTDRNDVTVEYDYNLYGAPLFRRVKDSTQGDYYEYTPEGLLKSAISDGMKYAYEYDEMDRLVCKSASGRTLLTMAYDRNGNRIRQTDVTGKATDYQYNSLDLLIKVWDDENKLAEYQYNTDGTICEEKNGPLSKQYWYDQDKNLTGIRVQAGENLLVDNQYLYDGNGNRTHKKQLGGETLYHFDTLNQLTKVEYPGYSEELFYDKSGNRTQRIVGSVEEQYQYDPRNRLTELTRNGAAVSFIYDNAGNLLKDDKADYTYDAFNRTIKVETFDGNVQVNRYDAEELRYEMEENGQLVQFIFNQDKEVVTEVASSEINRLIRATSLIARNTDAVRMYYHYASDEMGSTTHVVDEDGQVLNRYEYDAWGNITEQEEAVPNRFKYTGQQLDVITQQYYLRARFYNPVIARFTQEDTYRGDGLNLYTYCVNNPVYYVDPSGHQPDCVKDAAQKYIKQGMTEEEAYRRAYAEHANKSLKDPNNLTARERYELEQRRARLIYAEAERVTGMNRDEIRTAAHIGNESNLQVLAIYEQNGQRYMDVNPTARADSYRTGEAIPVSVTAPDGGTISLSGYRGQNNTSSSHGEIGAMNQSYMAGTQGGDATLTVLGQPVCPTCQNRNVRTMAAASSVGTLTVNDYMSNSTYQFNGSNNGFFSGSRGGVTWSSGRISNYNPSTEGN